MVSLPGQGLLGTRPGDEATKKQTDDASEGANGHLESDQTKKKNDGGSGSSRRRRRRWVA